MTSTSTAGYDPPLLGVRVTDLVIGPMQAVSRHFLDLGAQVTRAHLPGVTASAGFGPVVDGIALGSAIAARGSRVLTADLSTPAGRQAWDDLLHRQGDGALAQGDSDRKLLGVIPVGWWK